MLKAAISQASIIKGFEREEPWYDHGDFTVLCGFVLGFMKQLIVLMNSRKVGLRYAVLWCVLERRWGDILTMNHTLTDPETAKEYRRQIIEGVDPKLERDNQTTEKTMTLERFFDEVYLPLAKQKRSWKDDAATFPFSKADTSHIKPQPNRRRYHQNSNENAKCRYD